MTANHLLVFEGLLWYTCMGMAALLGGQVLVFQTFLVQFSFINVMELMFFKMHVLFLSCGDVEAVSVGRKSLTQILPVQSVD